MLRRDRMTNKELFVEYLKLNNMVPQDFSEADLPNWDVFEMDMQQPWDFYGGMTPYSEDIAQRMWNRPDWRRRRHPGFGPGFGPGFNRPFFPLFWWWLLF